MTLRCVIWWSLLQSAAAPRKTETHRHTVRPRPHPHPHLPCCCHKCRVGQNQTFIGIYSLYTDFLAGKSPYIRSYTVCIYGSGQPYTSAVLPPHTTRQHPHPHLQTYKHIRTQHYTCNTHIHTHRAHTSKSLKPSMSGITTSHSTKSKPSGCPRRRATALVPMLKGCQYAWYLRVVVCVCLCLIVCCMRVCVHGCVCA
jgi:hypothetical protein